MDADTAALVAEARERVAGHRLNQVTVEQAHALVEALDEAEAEIKRLRAAVAWAWNYRGATDGGKPACRKLIGTVCPKRPWMR